MDGADSQSAQLPDAHPTFFLHGSPRAGDRTAFGDGRPDSGGIVRGDEPLRGGGSVWLDGWSADTDHQTLHGSSWS
jgi:hypothetical protein